MHRPIRAYKRPSITAADATTRHNSSGSDISQDGYTVYNGEHQHEEQEPVFNETEQDENAEVNTRFLVVPSNVYVLNKQLNPPKNTNNNNTKPMAYCDKERLRKAKIEMKRERKAARVLGIITGAFIVCWLPFFLLALISPFCPSCDFHPAIFSVCLWLGYLNSLLNPIIYTIFNPSFRNAFRKLIFKRHRRRRWWQKRQRLLLIFWCCVINDTLPLFSYITDTGWLRGAQMHNIFCWQTWLFLFWYSCYSKRQCCFTNVIYGTCIV